MSSFKPARIGQYGDKDRDLQKRISFERLSLSSKHGFYYKYLGVSTNITPDINDIQDFIFLENRDRSYDLVPIQVNLWYEFLPESQFDLSRFGIISPISDLQTFKMHTLTFDIDGLGRYPVVGDIIEVPFLQQDNIKRAFFEVTDVDRKPEFENFIVILSTKPVLHSQETSELHNEDGWVSDEDTLTDLMSNIDNEQQEEYTDTGLDDTGLDGVDQNTRVLYDPRPDISEEFLDNPDKVIF